MGAHFSKTRTWFTLSGPTSGSWPCAGAAGSTATPHPPPPHPHNRQPLKIDKRWRRRAGQGPRRRGKDRGHKKRGGQGEGRGGGGARTSARAASTACLPVMWQESFRLPGSRNREEEEGRQGRPSLRISSGPKETETATAPIRFNLPPTGGGGRAPRTAPGSPRRRASGRRPPGPPWPAP